MQKKAIGISGCTLVCGAVCIFLRWLQMLNCYDADTGLYVAGAASSWVLSIACLLFLAALFVMVRLFFPKPTAGAPAPAIRTHNIIFIILAAAAGVLLLAGGIAMLFGSGNTGYPKLVKILAVFVLITAVAMPGMAAGTSQDKPSSLFCLFAVVPVLMCCYWLIVEYKIYSQNPEVWIYAFDIIAVAASALSFYYIAGYFLGKPKPRGAVFFTQAAVFFCMIAVLDSSEPGHVPVLLGAALIQLMFSWVIIDNMEKRK